MFPAQQLSLFWNSSCFPIVLFSYQLSWENEAPGWGGQPEGLREWCCHSVHRDWWNGACVRWLPARGEQAPSSPAAGGPLAHQPGREGKTPPRRRCPRTTVPPATSVFSEALTQTEHSRALQVSRYTDAGKHRTPLGVTRAAGAAVSVGGGTVPTCWPLLTKRLSPGSRPGSDWPAASCSRLHPGAFEVNPGPSLHVPCAVVPGRLSTALGTGDPAGSRRPHPNLH